jgi:integrase
MDGIGVSILVKEVAKMRVFKRKFKSGVKWGVDYTIGGRRKRVIIGETNKKRIKLGLPADGNGKPIPKTITEALEIYFDEKLPSFRSPSIVKTSIGKESAFRKKFGKYSLDDVSKSDMEAFRDSLFKKNLAYSSIRRNMATVSSFFNWAINQKPPWLQGENPARCLFGSCRATTTNPGWTKHILAFEEAKKIIDLARGENPQRADYYLWLFLAMQRPSEAKRIRFENFDTDKWTLTIAQTKRGGKAKIIPVDGELREIYWRQLKRRDGKDGFMWPQSYFNPHATVFKRYCSELDINLKHGNSIYILKASGVSFMVNVLGVPVKIVSEISGVSIPMITRHYLKANETQLRLALRNASWHFSGTQEDQQIPYPSLTLANQDFPQYQLSMSNSATLS